MTKTKSMEPVMIGDVEVPANYQPALQIDPFAQLAILAYYPGKDAEIIAFDQSGGTCVPLSCPIRVPKHGLYLVRVVSNKQEPGICRDEIHLVRVCSIASAYTHREGDIGRIVVETHHVIPFRDDEETQRMIHVFEWARNFRPS